MSINIPESVYSALDITKPVYTFSSQEEKEQQIKKMGLVSRPIKKYEWNTFSNVKHSQPRFKTSIGLANYEILTRKGSNAPEFVVMKNLEEMGYIYPISKEIKKQLFRARKEFAIHFAKAKKAIANFTGSLLYITGHETWSMNSRDRIYREYNATFYRGVLVSCELIHEDSSDYAAPDHGYGYKGGLETIDIGRSVYDLTEEEYEALPREQQRVAKPTRKTFDAIYERCTRQNGEYEQHTYVINGIGGVPSEMFEPLISQISC